MMHKYALGIGRRVLRALVAEMASKMILHVLEDRLACRVDLILAAGLSFGRVVRLDPRFEVGEDVRAQNVLHKTLVVLRLECLLEIQPVSIGDWWEVSMHIGTCATRHKSYHDSGFFAFCSADGSSN